MCLGFGFIVFKDLVSVDCCLRDKKNHFIQGKAIECKKANPKPDDIGNLLKQFNSNSNNEDSSSNESSSQENDVSPLNNDDSCKSNSNNNNRNKLNKSHHSDNSDNFSFSFFLPELNKSNHKDINTKTNKKTNTNNNNNNNFNWEYSNHYANPTNADNLNNSSPKSKKNKLKYNFRHLYDEKQNSFEEEEINTERENEPINLFIYQQKTSNIDKPNKTSSQKESIKTSVPLSSSTTNSLNKDHSNLFENYFNNYIMNPKLNAHNKFRLFDINGEDASILSTYQNTTRVKLFKIESEGSSTSDKDSDNSIKNSRPNSNNSNNNSNDSSSNNSNSSSSNNNYIHNSSGLVSSPQLNNNINSVASGSSSSKLSDSIVAIGSDYKDSDEEQKPNDTDAYYGPRIHKASKFFSSNCNFQPY